MSIWELPLILILCIQFNLDQTLSVWKHRGVFVLCLYYMMKYNKQDYI